MDLKSVIIYSLVVLVILVEICATRHIDVSIEETSGSSISEILFGKLWSFNEYCGDTRAASTKLRDDEESELFFNGTYHEQLSSSGNRLTLTDGLTNISYSAVKAKVTSTLICSASAWGYASEDIEKESNPARVNRTECSRRLEQIYCSMRALVTSKNLVDAADTSNLVKICPTFSSVAFEDWRQVNSFGHVPAGQFFDRHLWPGDYSGCLKNPDNRYCYGAYRSPKWPLDSDLDTRNVISFRIGLCVPKVCDSQTLRSGSIKRQLDELVKSNLVAGVGLTNSSYYRLTDVFCPPTDDSRFRQLLVTDSGDYLRSFLLILPVAWALLLLCGTLVPRAPSWVKGYFDLGSIWSEFRNSNHAVPELAGLNAIKVVAMLWLMLCHFCMMYVPHIGSTSDLRSVGSKSMLAAFILQGQHSVHVFFIISGFLVGYKDLRRSQPVGALRFVLHRYFRLMPMYLLVYVYLKKFGHLLGSGPLWDHGVSAQSEALQCMQESWWVPVLMLANFIQPFKHCVLTGWHIANDFQIYLLLPVLLSAFRRRRIHGVALSLAGFYSSHLYHVYTFNAAANYNYRQLVMEPFTLGPMLLCGRLAYAYVNPFARVGTYFLGILLADLMIDNQERVVGDKDAQRHEPIMLSVTKPNGDQDPTLSETIDRVADYRRHYPAEVKSSQRCHRPLGWLLSPPMNSILRLKGSACVAFGLLLLWLASNSPNWPTEIKFALGSEYYGYPLCRYLAELGWFALLYGTLVYSPASGARKQLEASGGGGNRRRVGVFMCSPASCPGGMSERANDPQAATSGHQDGGARDSSAGPWNSALKSRAWNLAAKLNYSLILTHFTVARYFVQTQTQLLAFNWLNLFQLASSFALASYLLALALHLSVEMPLTLLVRRLTSNLLGR